ncbi:hypothetical protein AGLY_000814 [Aphis glycines]|uniref:Uncharacterized protein n=1 Tax=Aphis glycines TaxID=307491 RepID=A0A6G0U819_APHGL|nr:hypothetical protein AGLY_000814 [Aphis glycines]
MSIFFGLDCLTNSDVTELRLSSPELCEFNRASQSTNIAHQKHNYDTIVPRSAEELTRRFPSVLGVTNGSPLRIDKREESSRKPTKSFTALRTGFEPVRAEPIGFRVQLLNHSDTAAHAGKPIDTTADPYNACDKRCDGRISSPVSTTSNVEVTWVTAGFVIVVTRSRQVTAMYGIEHHNLSNDQSNLGSSRPIRLSHHGLVLLQKPADQTRRTEIGSRLPRTEKFVDSLSDVVCQFNRRRTKYNRFSGNLLYHNSSWCLQDRSLVELPSNQLAIVIAAAVKLGIDPYGSFIVVSDTF